QGKANASRTLTKKRRAANPPPERAKTTPKPAEQAHNPIAPPPNLCFTFRQTHKKSKPAAP
ncbi:hypothetical protein PQR36_38235, partial [Paraburkholderia nemoris]|uniref:hypothetical protein n=1 Tax=Paraburkholderia nemoris TaxID=2793076 RepID=UPI0038B8143D